MKTRFQISDERVKFQLNPEQTQALYGMLKRSTADARTGKKGLIFMAVDNRGREVEAMYAPNELAKTLQGAVHEHLETDLPIEFPR